MQVSTSLSGECSSDGQKPEDSVTVASQKSQASDAFLKSSSSCFTQKTQIKTKRGNIKASQLQVGDMVLTRDHGYQPIRWLGRRTSQEADTAEPRRLWPIRIKRNALGANTPERHLVVSPKHRILLAGDIIQQQFGVPEIFVKAQDLIAMPGNTRVRPENLVHVYFMFDHHELVLSDGVWTESHQPDDPTISALNPRQRASLFKAFPHLNEANGTSGYPAARHTLDKSAVMALLVPA